MREAARLSEISTSMIRRMFEIVERARKEGREIVSLTIGEPDFSTPREVIERAVAAMNSGYTHYTSNFGLDELREVIAERYGVPTSDVMITAGGSEALMNASLALIERGSRVIIPTPNFLSYFTYAKLCEARIEEVRTHDTGFKPDPDRINEVMDRDVSVIFLNYPNNPTGVVAGKKELREIVEIASDYNAVVISDEIYDQIHYDAKPISLAGYENVVVVNGFSKSLSMTGWRIGFTIAGESLLDSMLKVHQVNGVCAPAFAQKAVADVIGDGLFDKIVSEMVSEFRRRRDYVYSELSEIYEVVKPEGAFYMFVNVNEDCMAFIEKLLQFGVAVTPGLPFGTHNKTYVRISYANSMENLKKAVKAFREYESQKPRSP
ncbi:pyridoxal phosphate-dependent aminotransferase [Archaeoglobus neptunius]|uniref:pyridoxal phosphate-dependent aminotransferase n=1 Tax=Archaeoglobus neptunius TaxID=2798580 RepID=UPI001926D9CD|nr:aminotransferase class I/II-fold pyridoxal phosphate-dependent enzyme [Archaeoglobus neptunius]